MWLFVILFFLIWDCLGTWKEKDLNLSQWTQTGPEVTVKGLNAIELKNNSEISNSYKRSMLDNADMFELTYDINVTFGDCYVIADLGFVKKHNIYGQNYIGNDEIYIQVFDNINNDTFDNQTLNLEIKCIGDMCQCLIDYLMLKYENSNTLEPEKSLATQIIDNYLSDPWVIALAITSLLLVLICLWVIIGKMNTGICKTTHYKSCLPLFFFILFFFYYIFIAVLRKK